MIWKKFYLNLSTLWFKQIKNQLDVIIYPWDDTFSIKSLDVFARNLFIKVLTLSSLTFSPDFITFSKSWKKHS